MYTDSCFDDIIYINAKAKILCPAEFKSLGNNRKNKNTEVKFEELERGRMGVIDNTVYLQYVVTKNPRGFLIKDKIFAKTLKSTFDKIWNKGDNE